MDREEKIISWGAGVNSTAIIALHLLGELEGKPEIVFADTGAELPETYEYIETVSDRLRDDGWTVTILHPQRDPHLYEEDCAGVELYDFLWDSRTLPGWRTRVCSSRYKSRPIRRYASGRTHMIGICADESHRLRGSKLQTYPVRNYTRHGCEALIRKAGLPAAHKTGCYLCPFQPKAQWIDLYERHPGLFQKCVDLEDHSLRRRYRDGSLSIRDRVDGWLQERKLEEAQLILF